MEERAGRSNTRTRGKEGEERAVVHLLEQGYQVLARNYQTRRGELDCVARDGDGTLVFIEVKYSRSRGFANPLFWVTPAKQRQIAMMARWYLAEHRLFGRPCRFDVIAICGERLEHLRNAFFAPVYAR